MNLHRKLTPSEELEFRKWARDNYEMDTKIEISWHPIVINEIGVMYKERYISENLKLDDKL